MLNFFQMKYFDVDTHEHLILEVYTSLVNVRGICFLARYSGPKGRRNEPPFFQEQPPFCGYLLIGVSYDPNFFSSVKI